MGKKLLEIMSIYMNADLDPNPGKIPKFHPLWDPHITHQRSSDSDGSIPVVYGMNVFDVGFFNSSGEFTLLFNLCLSKEENEKSQNFEFKTIRFVPLVGVRPRLPQTLPGSNLSILSMARDNTIDLNKLEDTNDPETSGINDVLD